MNLINELRELAEDLYVGGYNRYSAAMSKAADELGSLERYRTAYNEWVAKTEWVQADTSLPAKYLGMHRADVLKGTISELLDRLEAAEKERDDVAQQLVQSEIGKREISEAHNTVTRRLSVLADENAALRAKVAEMEQQESVATVIKEGDSRYWMSERLWTFPDGKYPLYALPGAQGE